MKLTGVIVSAQPSVVKQVAEACGVRPGQVCVPSMVGRTEATVTVRGHAVALLRAPAGSGKHPGAVARTLEWTSTAVERFAVEI